MTRREAAIVSAYTGFMIGEFSDMHEYAEHLLGEPVFTSTFGNPDFAAHLRAKAKADFCAIRIDEANAAPSPEYTRLAPLDPRD